MRSIWTIIWLALASATVSSMTSADIGGDGITDPIRLAPFDPSRPKCSAPVGLSRTLAFARDNDRAFIDGIDQGLALAALDNGLAYRSVVADNDAATMIRQLDEFRTQNVGAIVVAPVDPASLAPHLQQVIWSGAYVGAIVPPPATTILNAPQYLTGKALGDAAASYITSRLEGKANVVLLTHDSLEFLAPRFTAMRDSLATLPDAVIVADISPLTVNNEGGYATMQTILLAEPRIDVVLGADTVVLGALAAMRDAGLARSDQFFGGIDGEPDAVAELREPDSPYKASISLASPIFGYAMGVHAADWLAGKSIPQAIDVLPIALTADTLQAYESDLADPGAVVTNADRRDRYLRFYGNICYENRDDYLNFPWSSEN
jgi:ribose transport system substrate-binding protein